MSGLRYNLDLVLSDAVDSDDTLFEIGNTVSQTLSGGVVITGEIVDYNDSDNIVSLAHIGADDGKFHMFTTGTITSTNVNGDPLTRTVTSTTEQVAYTNAQNDDFDDIDFIDFSETNPFGDPV